MNHQRINEIWEKAPLAWLHDGLPEKRRKALINDAKNELFDHILFEPNSVVVDWGCGAGLISAELEKYLRRNSILVLADLNQKIVNKAINNLDPNLEKPFVWLLTITDGLFEIPNLVDVIVCTDVIFHFPSFEYFEKVAKFWIQCGPKYIALSLKIGPEKENTVTEDFKYEKGLILTHQYLLDTFPEPYVMIHNATHGNKSYYVFKRLQ